MRIVFFGTPEFAVPSLRALLRERYPVVWIVTRPDRPQGRSRSTLVAPPVKVEADRAGIPVLQPVRPLGDVFLAGLRRLEPDLGVVVAYGHILRPAVLSLPTLGMINVHASLLPRWRGAAPIQHAILAGDTETGVSIMQMEEALDSRPVLHRSRPIGRETAGSLASRLAELGATALVDALSCWRGFAKPEAQDGRRHLRLRSIRRARGSTGGATRGPRPPGAGVRSRSEWTTRKYPLGSPAGGATPGGESWPPTSSSSWVAGTARSRCARCGHAGKARSRWWTGCVAGHLGRGATA
jgi:methionyl-tRNA formyltransferase